MEAREVREQAARAHVPTGIRGALADRRLLRWLIGASLAWLLFDFVYYGNTISSPVIIKLVSPHASLIGQAGWALAIFAVAGVSLLGLLATVALLPEPKGASLEEFTEDRYLGSAVALALAESRGTRPPSA